MTKQFDVVYAEFRPTRENDLAPGAAEWIGRRMRWQAMYVIEYGPFMGDWLMMPTLPPFPPFAWAPSSDLDVSACPRP